MKILVKKDIGFLIVGNTYEAQPKAGEETFEGYLIDNNFIGRNPFYFWLKNGYIEKVKEVSYTFEDFSETLSFSPCLKIEVETLCATEKQAQQIQAFAKLTHVWAKILKDFGFEGWEPEYKKMNFVVYFNLEESCFRVHGGIFIGLFGRNLSFPSKETAELALQHNQELFKTYLGV